MNTRTNEQIIADALQRGFIEEKEISLLQRRGNAACEYPITDDFAGIKISMEQGCKGLQWLYKECRKRNSTIHERDKETIMTASIEDFTFQGFHDAGRFRPIFVPIYDLNGFTYCVVGGNIVIY